MINIKKAVIYKAVRALRVKNNKALRYAYDKAREMDAELIVIYTRNTKNFAKRWLCDQKVIDFLDSGVEHFKNDLTKLKIRFEYIKSDTSTKDFIDFCLKENVSLIVSDSSPMREHNSWQISMPDNISHEIIDAHNLVPVTIASNKQEFAARTIRPKILEKLSAYIEDDYIVGDHLPDKIESYGLKVLEDFVTHRLSGYAKNKNDVNLGATSHLSAYINFGFISKLEIYNYIKNNYRHNNENKKDFLEEFIIRNELAENFCYYDPNFDNYNGLADWAKRELDKHRADKREYLYDASTFENAKTHDELWNAAQMEMIQTGKMSGYMRMYWAKKILEWTESPEKAIEIAIYLNDKYNIDGWSPNGYAGILWSIGGLHDRPWFVRPIYGMIRYMARSGCEKKFDVSKYIAKYSVK